MASIKLDINSAEVTALQRTLLNFYGQYNWVAAKAMTNAAKDTRDAIRTKILPMVQGGATTWTRRGLIVKYARPNDLTAMAGFQYGDGNWSDTDFTRKSGGVAAGRYMGVNSSGGDRRPKSSELQLRRARLIGNDQFITPASSGVRLNAQGNVSGPEYQRIVSRVRGFSTAGSDQNAPRGAGSRGRSARKRRESDYFVMRRDGEAQFIAKRVGKRGFVPALFITDQPNYERRFRIQPVAMAEYQRVFSKEFESALEKEMAYQAKKAQ